MCGHGRNDAPGPAVFQRLHLEVYFYFSHQAVRWEYVTCGVEAVVDLAGPLWLGRWLCWALTPMERSWFSPMSTYLH